MFSVKFWSMFVRKDGLLARLVRWLATPSSQSLVLKELCWCKEMFELEDKFDLIFSTIRISQSQGCLHQGRRGKLNHFFKPWLQKWHYWLVLPKSYQGSLGFGPCVCTLLEWPWQIPQANYYNILKRWMGFGLKSPVFSELRDRGVRVLLFSLGKTHKTLPKSRLRERILCQSAGSTKLDQPHCKQFLKTLVHPKANSRGVECMRF